MSLSKIDNPDFVHWPPLDSGGAQTVHPLWRTISLHYYHRRTLSATCFGLNKHERDRSLAYSSDFEIINQFVDPSLVEPGGVAPSFYVTCVAITRLTASFGSERSSMQIPLNHGKVLVLDNQSNKSASSLRTPVVGPFLCRLSVIETTANEKSGANPCHRQ